MQDQILREIAIEMQELEADFSRKMEAMRRKLRIALGDIKPRKSVVEFKNKKGKTIFKIDE